MSVPAADVLDHSERARSLREWEVALWWLGLSCVVLASALLVIGKVGLMAAVVCVYWVVATARNACGRAADRHADWLREDARLHHQVHGREKP